jgi:predicted metalloprotease
MDRRARPWWSVAVRWSLVVVMLALMLGACSVEVVPSSQAATPTEQNTGEPAADGTAGDTTVDAQPAADDTRTGDEQTAVRIVNTFWQRWFAAQHRRYVPPRVRGGYTGTHGPRCAGEPSVPGNAYYCPSGNFLAWDENLMRGGYTQIGDAWVYLVIAHEWGHAIQGQLPAQYVSQAVELQADCLAGAALNGAAQEGLVQIEPGDDVEIATTLEAVADDYPWTDQGSHGDAQQRIAAFRTGVARQVDGCLTS